MVQVTRESNIPIAKAHTRFCAVLVSFSSNVRRMRVSGPFTRGSVRRGRNQYSRKDAAKSIVVSCASLTVRNDNQHRTGMGDRPERTHIGRNKHPLRQCSIDNIIRKVVEVPDALGTCGVLGDGVEDDKRVVLAYVVRVHAGRGIGIVRGIKTDVIGISIGQARNEESILYLKEVGGTHRNP